MIYNASTWNKEKKKFTTIAITPEIKQELHNIEGKTERDKLQTLLIAYYKYKEVKPEQLKEAFEQDYKAFMETLKHDIDNRLNNHIDAVKAHIDLVKEQLFKEFQDYGSSMVKKEVMDDIIKIIDRKLKVQQTPAESLFITGDNI